MPAASPARLKRRAEFLRAAREGRKAAEQGLVLQALCRPDALTRVGFTATKKLGSAVVRNRAKRRLREVARLGLAAHPAAGWDLVLIAREATGSLPFAALRAEFEAALTRAGVRR